jgi:hypothetical protein
MLLRKRAFFCIIEQKALGAEDLKESRWCYKRIWLLGFLPLGLLLTLLARWQGGWVESVHAKYLYPLFADSLGWLLSLAPFSVLEVLILLGGAALIAYLIIQMVRAAKEEKEARKDRLIRLGLNLAGALSVGYFCFVLFMGLNYYRQPIARHLNLQVGSATQADLYALCEDLVKDCNAYRAQLQEGADGVALPQSDYWQTAASARAAYAELEKELPLLQAADIRNKPLLTSRLFSRVLTTGIYIPFESGINVDAPPLSIPATMCHELTHYRGFMREEEANFISYLACMKSDRADFKYSASMLAFTYAFSDLVYQDVEAARKIAGLCSEGLLRDLQAEDDYWNQYRETVVGDTSQIVYNEYLQMNGQELGIDSYGEMVNLLIAYRKSK